MGSDMTSSHTLPAAAVTDADDVADLHAAHYAKSAGAGRRITDDDQLHEARWEAITEAPRRDGQTILPAGQASDAGAASPPSSTASRSAPANI